VTKKKATSKYGFVTCGATNLLVSGNGKGDAVVL
jgi:hypothetical protein